MLIYIIQSDSQYQTHAFIYITQYDLSILQGNVEAVL